MNKTRTRIESSRRRARGTLRSFTGRANRLPVLYAKAWSKEMAAWSDLATDVLDGCAGVGDVLSGMFALSLSGLQTSVDLGRAACELIIHPCAPSGPPLVEFHLDGDSQAADPVELDVTPPVEIAQLSATDLRNVDNPNHLIPAANVRFTTPGQPSAPVLVSLINLTTIVPNLPDGTYEGKIRRGGVDIATIRALLDA